MRVRKRVARNWTFQASIRPKLSAENSPRVATMGRHAKNLPTVRFRTRFEKQRRGRALCRRIPALAAVRAVVRFSITSSARASAGRVCIHINVYYVCALERGGRRFRPSVGDNAHTHSFSPLFSSRNGHAGKFSRLCGKFLCTHLERGVD